MTDQPDQLADLLFRKSLEEASKYLSEAELKTQIPEFLALAKKKADEIRRDPTLAYPQGDHEPTN
jgi:hypothetical protein